MTARALGLLRAAPMFFAGILPPFALHWLRRVGDGNAMRGVWRLLRSASKTTSLVLVSHHFMSKDELESPLGQERLAHCVFRVPINGQMLSMCEVNALGIRERYYDALNSAAASGREAQYGGDFALPVVEREEHQVTGVR
jgi:hypothetical protein